jgi:hypothetical protein
MNNDKGNNVYKIAFLAATGYGKTTAANIIMQKYKAYNIKLSQPLYEMQTAVYSILNIDTEGRQDGELLQFLGNKIQRDYPEFLAAKLKDTMDKILAERTCDIIINDDCRPHNYSYLKEIGFVFIKINSFAHNRNDFTSVDSSNNIEWQEPIPFDYEVDNWGTMEDFTKNLYLLFDNLVCNKIF